MSWKICLEHGHTAKRCHETIATCVRCSCEGYSKDKCTSNEVKCYDCGEGHQTYSRNCPVFKKEMEIVRIKTKECIPRQQAIRNLLRLNPHPELIYSHTVKNASNRTIAKSPNRTEQEGQFESSKDDSSAVPFCNHGYYTKEKDQKERSPTSPPLTVCDMRVEWKDQKSKRRTDVKSKSNQIFPKNHRLQHANYKYHTSKEYHTRSKN